MSAALKAEIERMRAQAADLARNAEMLSRRLDALADMEDSMEPAGPRYISLKRASIIADRTEETTRDMVKAFKLGHKSGPSRSARWLVDEVKLNAHLDKLVVAQVEDSR